MITIVTLNWARPENTIANLRQYAAYPAVQQVLCFNNGPPLRRPRNLSTKCVILEASRDLGLYSRLAAAALARTDAIFHTDDDIVVPEVTLMRLMEAWIRSPHSCHGLHGRRARPSYQRENAIGPVEIVLTRALMCSRQVSSFALSATHYFDDLPSVPEGNGEDIILSFAAMAATRCFNMAYALPSAEYVRGTEHAIHRRWPEHFAHRSRIVARCRGVFSVS
jgi:hypothetical protein